MSHQWAVERTFASYEEALKYKTSIQMSERGALLHVKIKMYASANGVPRYGVKTRNDPSLTDAIKDVEEKINKKKNKPVKE